MRRKWNLIQKGTQHILSTTKSLFSIIIWLEVVGVLHCNCWSFLVCLFGVLCVFGLLRLLVLHLSTRREIYLSDYEQTMQVLEASMAGVFVFSAQSEPMSLEEVKERPPDAAMNSKEARADLGEEVEGLRR
ncbi:hypothetical protein ACOSQ2_009659 [Xanthoceras sorbifolium]